MRRREIDPEELGRDLFEVWDPIGVRELGGFADEYDAYVPRVRRELEQGSGVKWVFDALWHVETCHIGNPGDREKTLAFAEYLVAKYSR